MDTRPKGITLSDYFASQVVARIETRPKNIWQWIRWLTGKPYLSSYASYADIAKTAYNVSEAMIKERYERNVENYYTFEHLIKDHGEWADTTFPKGTSKGALLHAHREIDEIIADIESGAAKPTKAKEYADAIFCLLDSARRESISLDEITNEGYNKLLTNKSRKWKYNGDGSYSHIK